MKTFDRLGLPIQDKHGTEPGTSNLRQREDQQMCRPWKGKSSDCWTDRPEFGVFVSRVGPGQGLLLQEAPFTLSLPGFGQVGVAAHFSQISRPETPHFRGSRCPLDPPVPSWLRTFPTQGSCTRSTQTVIRTPMDRDDGRCR